ncbi:hypothetical protein BDDG_13733, partial [Blastomyces dermatitidis ATCC 18188]
MGTASGKGGLMWRAAPDQSYRLFCYTPQILRTLRSSAILDRRSSAATLINHIDYSVTLHRFYVCSDPRPFSIATPINHIDYSVTLHRFH